MTEGACVCVIFARGGSKGVPRKNVRPFAGKPLIAHAIEVAQRTPEIDRVLVSTDDDEIAEVSERYGAEVPFRRPAELAGDTSAEWLAWQHAIGHLRARGEPIDTLVTLPPTAPLRAPEDVSACIAALDAGTTDVVITVEEARRSPYYNMVRLDTDGLARLVIEPASSVHRRQDAPAVFDMTTVAYAARAAFVEEGTGLFAGRVRAVVVPSERAIDIDTLLDFDIAEMLYRRRKPS